jgi:poly(A) polymerase
VRADKSVTPTFLFAVLLWPALRRAYDRVPHAEESIIPDLLDTCDQVTFRQQKRIAVPKRFTLPMRDLIALQPRFERSDGKRALRLLDHPRFRAAYDLLLLRAAAGEVPQELADWWTQIQNIPAEERQQHVAQSSEPAQQGSQQPARSAAGTGRRRRRKRAPRA